MGQIQTYSKYPTPHVRRVVIPAGVRSSGGVDVAAVTSMNKDRFASTSLVGKNKAIVKTSPSKDQTASLRVSSSV